MCERIHRLGLSWAFLGSAYGLCPGHCRGLVKADINPNLTCGRLISTMGQVYFLGERVEFKNTL